MTIGLDSSPMCWPGMFASSWALTAASVTFWNATLCGPPETMMYLTASPDFTVMLAGSNLYPVASPIIFTSWVVPVAGAAATAPAAGAAPVPVLGVAAAVEGAGVLVAAALAAAVSVADLFSPPQAPRTVAPARSAIP